MTKHPFQTGAPESHQTKVWIKYIKSLAPETKLGRYRFILFTIYIRQYIAIINIIAINPSESCRRDSHSIREVFSLPILLVLLQTYGVQDVSARKYIAIFWYLIDIAIYRDISRFRLKPNRSDIEIVSKLVSWSSIISWYRPSLPETVRSARSGKIDCCSHSEWLWSALVSDVKLVMSRANVNLMLSSPVWKFFFIWVDLESLLIYLVRRDSGAPVWE